MKSNTPKIIFAIIIIIIVLVGLYAFFIRKPGSLNQTMATSTGTTMSIATTTHTVGGVQVSTTGGGQYSVTPVSTHGSTSLPKPIPDLNRPIMFGASTRMTAASKTDATNKILAVQASLKNNPADPASWVQLGILEKMIADYPAAVVYYQYAAKLAPIDFISLGDLADLYGYYLHDSTKAESYFKQALQNGPTQEYLYVQFATFYRDVVKDTVQARAIIDQGLVKIPNDPALLQLKGTL